jgi:hypothetical protein
MRSHRLRVPWATLPHPASLVFLPATISSHGDPATTSSSRGNPVTTSTTSQQTTPSGPARHPSATHGRGAAPAATHHQSNRRPPTSSMAGGGRPPPTTLNPNSVDTAATLHATASFRLDAARREFRLGRREKKGHCGQGRHPVMC